MTAGVWKMTNAADREALAEAAWLLAAVTDVRVTVRCDYVGRTHRRNPGTGLHHQVGEEHHLAVTFARGKASVAVELRGPGVYLTLRSHDRERLGRSVIVADVLRTLYDRTVRPVRR